MVTGHFATALVPHELMRQRRQAVSIWVFLVAAQALDFLMIGLVSAHVETLLPGDLLDLSFAGMRTDMFLSHDLVPVLGWAALIGLGAWAFTRNGLAALWCVALVLFHEACDLVVGFEHRVMFEGTPSLGLQLYTRAPVQGLLIEALMCAALIGWFVRQRALTSRPASNRLKWGLHVLLTGSALASIPLAHQSIRGWLG